MLVCFKNKHGDILKIYPLPANVWSIYGQIRWLVFTSQMYEKTPVEEWLLSKNGGHQHQGVFFTTFACRIQLTGFFIHGTLASNGITLNQNRQSRSYYRILWT